MQTIKEKLSPWYDETQGDGRFFFSPITSCSSPIKGVAFDNLVAHNVLIISANLRKTRGIKSYFTVGTVISSVSYDGTGFAKATAISEGR